MNSSEIRFNLDNTETERVVRSRITVLAAAFGFVGGVIGYFVAAGLPRAGPLPFWDAVVSIVGITVVAALVGYAPLSRMVVRVFVPRSLSLGDASVIGDFRRKGWSGPPIREMRFDDVRSVARTPELGIAVVRGRFRPGGGGSSSDTSFFYLTDRNAAAVRKAVAEESRSGVSKK